MSGVRWERSTISTLVHSGLRSYSSSTGPEIRSPKTNNTKWHIELHLASEIQRHQRTSSWFRLRCGWISQPCRPPWLQREYKYLGIALVVVKTTNEPTMPKSWIKKVTPHKSSAHHPRLRFKIQCTSKQLLSNTPHDHSQEKG